MQATWRQPVAELAAPPIGEVVREHDQGMRRNARPGMGLVQHDGMSTRSPWKASPPPRRLTPRNCSCCGPSGVREDESAPAMTWEEARTRWFTRFVDDRTTALPRDRDSP